jgi:hypothetical protein
MDDARLLAQLGHTHIVLPSIPSSNRHVRFVADQGVECSPIFVTHRLLTTLRRIGV